MRVVAISAGIVLLMKESNRVYRVLTLLHDFFSLHNEVTSVESPQIVQQYSKCGMIKALKNFILAVRGKNFVIRRSRAID